MGIFQSDLILKSAIELSLKEMRDNQWLLDDVFRECVEDPFLNEIYGQKEIDNAKEWLRNNEIPVLLKFRNSPQSVPCITIALGDDVEDERESTLSDQTTDSVELAPAQIGKKIPYIITPFVPVSFDPATGLLEVPPEIGLADVAPEMVLVDEAGNGYKILDYGGENGLLLEGAAELDATKVGVLPKNMKFKARVEGSSFRQSFTIGCHVSGDPSSLLWLHSIVLYGLLRYKETLLEARGFKISTPRSTDINRNPHIADVENAFSRYISVTGLVQHTWIKTPQRFIEKVRIKDEGLDFITNEDTPESVQQSKGASWGTVPQTQQSKKQTLRRP